MVKVIEKPPVKRLLNPLANNISPIYKVQRRPRHSKRVMKMALGMMIHWWSTNLHCIYRRRCRGRPRWSNSRQPDGRVLKVLRWRTVEDLPRLSTEDQAPSQNRTYAKLIGNRQLNSMAARTINKTNWSCLWKNWCRGRKSKPWHGLVVLNHPRAVQSTRVSTTSDVIVGNRQRPKVC